MKIKSTILKICILLLFVMAVTSVAAAYNITNSQGYMEVFPTSKVLVEYGSLASSQRPVAEKSMATWNNVGAKVRLETRPYNATGHIKIQMSSSPLGVNIIARETRTQGKYNSTINRIEKVNSVINLNGFSFYFSATSPMPKNYIDLESVLTHELGHSLGLGHDNTKKTATMYEHTSPNDTSKRSLEADDREGLIKLYGRR